MEELSFDESLTASLELRGQKMSGVGQKLVSALSIQDVLLELLKILI